MEGIVRCDMQQSQCFGETHYGHIFSDVNLRYSSVRSFFRMLLGGKDAENIGYVLSYLLSQSRT